MSLLYRTIFSAARSNVIVDVRQAFQDWIRSKGIELDVPTTGALSIDGNEVVAAAAEEADLSAVRLSLHEERSGERWSTTITAIAAAGEPCVWLDLERVSEDPYGRPPVVAVPRLVHEVLKGGDCHCGPTTLVTEPSVVGESDVPELVRQLTDPERTIPLIVVSKDRYATPELAIERGQQLLTKVLGLAPVFILEGLATSALSEALGPDLHVFGGAVRSYLPELTMPDRAPKRHPYIAGAVFAGQTTAAASRIQRSLSQQAIAQRPPEIYRDRVIALPGFPHHKSEAKDEELVAELVEVEQERDQLAAQLKDTQDEIEFAALQLDETEAELDSAQARVRYLEGRLRAIGDQSANEPTPRAAVPETAESCAEAVGYARQYLSNLDIGDTEYFASVLDTHIKSPAWARKAWRALRALQDYAELKEANEISGDFLAYCETNPLGRSVVPASWVAMKESESTDNNPKYRGARTFPVPEEVDPDEAVYMCAHIKIEAGGRPAPRIHFYDDTAGTGFVYVGYFGEHLPNDQTN